MDEYNQNYQGNNNPHFFHQSQNIEQNYNTQMKQHQYNTQDVTNFQAQQVTAQLQIQELSKKVCISKLPPGTQEDFVKKLLGVCELSQDLKDWKRFKTANGDFKDGGIAEFHTIEGVFTCLKFIHNLKIGESTLIAKANKSTVSHLDEQRDYWRQEYIYAVQAQNIQTEDQNQETDIEVLKQKEEMADAVTNGLQEYEYQMVSGGSVQYPKIVESIINLVNGLQQTNQDERGNSEQVKGQTQVPDVDQYDPLKKYKEHEREKHRDRKIKSIEHDKALKFQRKLEDLERWEKNRDRERTRELERHESFRNVKERLLERDLNFDKNEERRLQQKYPGEYSRQIEERKRIRDREKVDDENDRIAEEKELAELQRQKLDELKLQEEQRKHEEEVKERMKLKRFMEMQEEMENKQKQDNIEQETPQKRQKIEDTHVSQQSNQNPKKEAPKISKEDQQRMMLKIKDLYKRLPSKKEDLFAYQLDWASLFDYDIITKICRPWIAKKIKEYMGVEEPMMINIVLKLLNQKCSDKQLLGKINNILDDASEEFVEKLWRVLVFEDMKIKAEITKR